MASASARSLSIGGRPYPLVLPNVRDPRLHVAAVIISIHVLGQVALHFHVSVPQILAAIVTAAAIEVAITFRVRGAFVWPASAMLTGSGVALILRVVGTPANQPWNVDGWWVFAGVAAFSLLTKYVIQRGGSHVFNPSNVGLVAAFVVLGSSRVEPLDFWWSPPRLALAIAYGSIIVGGLLITRRLRLLGLAVAFWLTFSVTIGILAASGHCMTANWAFAPVCGESFWTTIMTSPEVLVFLFFMITDPRTVPVGRVARVAFGILVAVVCTLLIAPQTDEWGTKVALLGGLVLMCAARPLIERAAPAPHSPTDRLSLLVLPGPVVRPVALLARTGVAAFAVLVVGLGIAAAGAPARVAAAPDPEALLAGTSTAVDPATLPAITIGPDADFSGRLAGTGIQAAVVTLGQNLELENLALLRRDASILPAVDHGDRLTEMRQRLTDAIASGRTTVHHYHFDAIVASLLVPFGVQTGLSLGLTSTGTETVETYDASGRLLDRTTSPFHLVFAMRRATGARWLDVAVLAPKPGS